ncbi:MAG: alpha-ketoglutarate-dependent dioxygenase AlkB, partial [Gammaproteobacteria bacterium]
MKSTPVAPEVVLLHGFTGPTEDIVAAVEVISAAAPFRHLKTPGGRPMSAAMTNCGALGWVSDRSGYRYDALDPLTDRPWPALPAAFAEAAASAAAEVGWPGFAPDACLVNRYALGAGVSLHQDRNERDFSQPIVTVSIGASCRFLLGGMTRSAPVQSFDLHDGDVMVWGGAARLVYHGVRPLRATALH